MIDDKGAQSSDPGDESESRTQDPDADQRLAKDTLADLDATEDEAEGAKGGQVLRGACRES